MKTLKLRTSVSMLPGRITFSPPEGVTGTFNVNIKKAHNNILFIYATSAVISKYDMHFLVHFEL